jgi:hypothetical protein
MSKITDLTEDKWIINFVEVLASLDPSPTKKYLPYLLKMETLEKYFKDTKKNFYEEYFKELKKYLQDYYDLCERNWVDCKDFSKLTLEQMEDIVKESKSKITESQIKKEETKYIYEDENFVVVRSLSQESSMLYGAGTTWCTASNNEGHNSHFESWTQRGVLVYFINKKGDTKTDPHAKIAFHNETDYNGKNNVTVWNAKDVQLTSGETMDVIDSYIPENVYKVIKEELYHGGKVDIIRR